MTSRTDRQSNIQNCPENCPASIEAWGRVAKAIASAKSVHYDGCHQIVLAMDAGQTQAFRHLGYQHDKPDLDVLRRWFKDSCELRVIEAVRTLATDHNQGSITLIDQFELVLDEEFEDIDACAHRPSN